MMKLENLLLVSFALMALVGFVSRTKINNPIVGKWNLIDLDINVVAEDSQQAERLQAILKDKYADRKLTIGNIFHFQQDGKLRLGGRCVGSYTVENNLVQLNFAEDLGGSTPHKFIRHDKELKVYCSETDFVTSYMANMLPMSDMLESYQAMVTLQLERI